MSSDELKTDQIREPKPRVVLLGGLCLLLAAGVLVFTGIRSRAKTETDLASWTKEQALPTVDVIKAQRGGGAQELVLPGDIQAHAAASLYARASGYVKAFYKDIGDTVKKGEVLAEIDTPELDQQYAQAKFDVATSEANFNLADATAKRYAVLVQKNVVSQQSDDEKSGDARAKQAALDSAKANLARIDALMQFKSLSAPFDGIVTARALDVGALVNSGGGTGTGLFQVSDISRVKVYVRVPQAYIAYMKPGAKATLDLIQYPGQHFDATVVRTSNAIAQETRTALVQLQAENPDGKLWPGTYAEVHFHLEPNANMLRLPATALVFGEQGVQVATINDDNAIVMKQVQIGQDIGSDVEVLAGLSPSDRVVNGPLETLTTGDTVRLGDTPAAKPPAVVQSNRAPTH
ncbi:efflux RND transporter periplasmic adaptor subunit [Aquabacter sp. CN5-332]|uniref:efflux RND transporter periplasmic adaptor subunit n=1 Tax=Aquabacter sp. CN5-332 TaxID=3156608 RepID=UPI0032B5CDCB